MKKVQPLRTKADVERVKAELRRHSMRDWTLFTVGVNTGLRVSDILSLRVCDILDLSSARLKIADRIHIVERKTAKNRDVLLNAATRSALREYVIGRGLASQPNAPLFPSRKGQGRQAISRFTAYRSLNVAARAAGVREAIGTHSMRKTFGYFMYTSGVDITRIQFLLNHSSPEVTLSYIGITRDETDKYIRGLNL